MKKHFGNKGFSVIELFVILAIVAILVAITVPQLNRYFSDEPEKKIEIQNPVMTRSGDWVCIRLEDAKYFMADSGGGKIILEERK